MYPQRLPIVGSDDGSWGNILNQYLEKEHYNTGSDNPANGGHQKITIRPGTASAGTAPLKFTSGTLLSTPEAGAMEYDGSKFYLTPTAANRKTIILTDNTAAATTTDVITIDVSGDTQKRLIINGDGKLEWGSGSAAVDTNLYRSAANWLYTDDRFSSASLVEANAVDSNTAVIIGWNGSSAAPAIAFGPSYDTNLYRSAANKLATDDELFANTDDQVTTRADFTTAFLLGGM